MSAKRPKVDSRIGAVVAGRYRVLRRIAQGGTGLIYEVAHERLKRNFAMKVLSETAMARPEVLARFRREADIVASLRHPNVVEIVDWESLDDGTPCIVMELLSGESLDRRIARGPLGWFEIARFSDEVMSALAVAHDAGIVHRDLKPQNIFIAEDDAGGERAKLLDFGLSTEGEIVEVAASEDDVLLGTPAYMSPEQADGRIREVGISTDVWAMGAIIYEMITGKRAFAAQSTMAVLYRICHGEPDPIFTSRADCPAELARVVEDAMSRDPTRRIEFMDLLRRRLRAALIEIEPMAFPEPTKVGRRAAEERDSSRIKKARLVTGPLESAPTGRMRAIPDPTSARPGEEEDGAKTTRHRLVEANELDESVSANASPAAAHPIAAQVPLDRFAVDESQTIRSKPPDMSRSTPATPASEPSGRSSLAIALLLGGAAGFLIWLLLAR